MLGNGLPGDWSWMTGFLGGGAFGFWMYFRDATPRHIERWRDGADGERWTEKQLRRLEAAGWAAAHDLTAKYGNVDHLVIGPGGVFLLDSKNWFGDVHVQNGVATVTPRDNPDAAWSLPRLTNGLRGASAANKEALEKLTGVRTWVQPVVVVWAPFEQRYIESAGVYFIAGQALADWLRDRPSRLSPDAVAKIRGVLAV